jgi:phosphoribosylanthranilate isomerase
VSTLVKFCGTTDVEGARAASQIGADFAGIILAPSPRRVSLDRAVEIASALDGPAPVAVFVNPQAHEVRAALARITNLVLQFSGDESPEFVASFDARTIKAIHVDPQGADESELRERADRYPSSLPLFDTRVAGLAGGTGSAFDWRALERIARERRIVVAGGLNPNNVAACVRAVHPYGVDVRGGIETDGMRDRAKMEAFFLNVRSEDRSNHDA